MKFRVLLSWCATVTLVAAQAEQLTPQQREAILKRLSVLQEASDSRFEARFRTAVQAFRGAMVSDEASFALYMGCLEKLDFTDKNRRAAEFREWRNKNEERLKDSAFRRALRHQLRWLVLTLQAASEDPDRAQLASSAQDIIDSIVADAANLTGQESVLTQSVLGSYFARAYEINRVKTEDWVMSPGSIGQVYEQIIFPQYRERRRVESLRSGWNKRIQQEIRLAEIWRFGIRSGVSGGQPVGPRAAEHEKFMKEDVPRMQWQMEVDLFEHGDPAGAAARMLTHLERNMTHPSAAEWLGALQALLAETEIPHVGDVSESESTETTDSPPPSAPVDPNPQPTVVEEEEQGSIFIE